jgi:lipopolysaccharide assembly outer membrane protein LptD (OstA)
MREAKGSLMGWVVMKRVVAVAAALAGGSFASAQEIQTDASPEAGLPYDIRAENLSTSEGGRVLTARGNVYIRQGRQILTAGVVHIYRDTDEAVARDNVVFIRHDGTVWKGEELKYNFKTGIGDFGGFMLYSDPYFVYGESFRTVTMDRIELQNVALTTCEDEDREFQIRASSAVIKDRRYLSMRNIVVYIAGVPVFWSPYGRRDLQSEDRWEFVPGASSRLGPFLLTTYNYDINDDGTVKGRSSVNLYSKRGVGLGQEVLWEDQEAGTKGGIEGFWIDDQKLYRDDSDEERRKDLLDDSQRYRLRLRHSGLVGERDSVYFDATHMSDPFLEEDFFRRTYRERSQPENRAAWTHRGDAYIFSLQANSRLNDFYNNVNRLPEASLTIPSLRLGETSLYYESQTTASNLERVYPELSDDEDYDAYRIDTRHTVYLPQRLFGFLALTPRAGWRGTYYSKTYADPVSVTNIVTNIDSNGVPVETESVVTTRDELGADLRNLYELGFETSYKAYKVMTERETIWGRGLRHVVEPYVRHTYIPDPDLLRQNLPQFDSVDRLGSVHAVQFGTRQKFQTRRGGALYIDHSIEDNRNPMASNAEGMDHTELDDMPSVGDWSVHDLINADIGTIFDLNAEEEENEFGPLYVNARIWPGRSFRFDFKSLIDMYGDGLTFFDGQVSLSPPGDIFSLSANYLYQLDRRDLVAAQLRLYPKAQWSFGAYSRFNIQTSRLEEHSYFVQRRMDCIGWGIGVRHEPGYEGQEDDYAAWLQFWLLAVPQSLVKLGR